MTVPPERTMSRKKVLYVISNVTDSTEYELLVAHWDRSRFELEFVFLNPEADCNLQRHLRNAGFKSTTIIYRGRKHALKAILGLMRLYRATRPHIIHLNLLEATFYGLIAAKLTGIGRTVYTRHHSTHNHKYHQGRGVMYDRLCNRWTDRIIAITRSTEEILLDWEQVPKEKVVLIYHGYDMAQVPGHDPAEVRTLAARHGIGTDGRAPVIGMIARPFEWKGLDHAIPAFRDVLTAHPNAKLVIFNWKGTPHTHRYEQLLGSLPSGSWHTVHFEPQVVKLFHAFDVFVHVPEDQHAEAFGLVYIESMLSGVPCVFSRSGIMHDLEVEKLKGVRMVPFKDKASITAAVNAWLQESPDASARAVFGAHNTGVLREVLDIRLKMKDLNRLYDSM